jgi:glycosyltransferase involved in cell wall biosynthesis
VKIAHLEYGRHLYGGARQVQHLIAGLSRSGVENVVICRPGAALAERCPARHVELPLYGDLDLGTVRRLRRVLRAEQPDVLHVHSRGGADLFGGVAGRAEGIATVLTRRVDNPEPRFWAQLKYRNYDAIAAISRAVELELVERAGILPARVRRIVSAVDPSVYGGRDAARDALERRWQLGRDERVIGIVAQLIERKGHDVLLAALPAIADRHPRVRVLCFGQGPRADRLRRRIAADPLLRERVVLAGHEPALEQYMPGFDLLVHPARAEGLGVAVLEAMSCGVPVIASAVGGLAESIEHARTGLLVPPDDPSALAAATIALLDAPARAQALAEAARASVAARHSVADMTARYLDLYGMLGARRHALH